ncbi:MAG TPA: hypothetical protein ENH86_01695 [Candidatus Jorgensenbacteria bacterium]|nr:hypothetical protein [Candidatus Jorgensenbacteria bacterium]
MIVRDIETSKPRLVFLKNLTSAPQRKYFIFARTIGVVCAASILLFNFSSVQAPATRTLYAAEHDADESSEEKSPQEVAAERKQLEEQLLELEEKMAEQQKIIEEYRGKGQTLKGEINQINAQIYKLNLQIKAVTLSLQKLDRDIYETQRGINNTQNQIEQHKDALAASIQSLYETDNQTMVGILLQNDRISDFFNGINDLLLIQNNIRLSLDDIVSLRQELIEQKQELNLEKDDIESLKRIRENRKYNLNNTQANRTQLLKITKNKESEFQNLLAETRKTAAQIRSRIFRLIGGGELTFESAYELARLAEGATGIRAAMTLAILDRESLLGKNVGRCTYETAMHPKRDIPVFKVILSTLQIDPNSLVARVSCPNTHGSYGGAMGPAQFIPSTWACYGGYVNSKTGSCRWGKNYTGTWSYNSGKDLIGNVTGNKPSNPWSNTDAFIATASYIEDLYNSPSCVEYGTANSHILPKQMLQERCAASKYYAGSRWRRYRFWYGDAVVNKANEFQKDIEVLQG